MIQIFLLGSSMVYGVGGADGGWGDLVKRWLHSKMYGDAGVGEKYELYNFGKSGETITFVLQTFPAQFEHYARGGKTIAVLSVGGNNSKAEGSPDNYVSTLDDYKAETEELLTMAKSKVDHVLVVGNGPVDESKTNPKFNPLTGGKSYFSNSRRQQFSAAYKELCLQHGITYIDRNVDEETWIKQYMYPDGIHPNREGHAYISRQVIAEIEKLL